MPSKPRRTDNSLNTGMSSVVERRSQQRLEEQQRKRAGVREAMLPSADILLEWIDKEIAQAKDLEHMIINISSEENVRAQLLGKQYYLESLKSMKNKIRVTLRQAKAADKKWYSTQDAPEAWVEAAEDIK